MQGIVIGDLHLRLDAPRCRIDTDWLQFQLDVLKFIFQQAKLLKCPVFISGDIFERAVSSVELLYAVMQAFKRGGDIRGDVEVYAIPGNHDLVHHNLANIDKSAYGILDEGLVFDYYLKDDSFKMFPFGTDTQDTVKDCDVAMLHRLVLPEDPGFNLGDSWCTASDLLKMYPDPDVFFIGDYHTNFVYRSDDGFRMIVNPGCMTVQSADMLNYKPVCYYVDTNKLTADKIELPNRPENIVIDYLVSKEERDTRIDAFVEMVKKNMGVGLSLEDNIKSYYESLAKEGIILRQEVKDIIEESLV